MTQSTRRAAAVVGTILMSLAGLGHAIAGPHTVQAPPGPEDPINSPDPHECEGYVRWEQLPDGRSALSSQDDQCYPFRSEVADDFIGDGDFLMGLGWWGAYWNGTPIPPDAFHITLYADEDGRPGEELLSVREDDYVASVGDPYGYCADLAEWVPLREGCVYHVSVVAEFCFPPKWGVATGQGNDREAHFRSEFYGYPDWTPSGEVFDESYDMAFFTLIPTGELDRQGGQWCCLPDGTCVPLGVCDSCPGERVVDCNECEATPVSRSSWGRVKSLYR